MSNPIGADISIREAVREKVNSLPLDKLVGHPTMKTWHHLRVQLCQMAAQVRTTNWGGRHGHLALVLNNAEYQTATNNGALITDRQAQPAQVHPLIDNNTTPLERAQLEASQRAQLQAWYLQEATDEAIVDRIIEEGIETHYIEELKNKYTTYTKHQQRHQISPPSHQA